MKKRILLTSTLLLAACAQPASRESLTTRPSKIDDSRAQRSLSFYPARRVELSDHRCRPYDGGCVELTRKQPVLTLRDFNFHHLEGGDEEQPEVVLHLNPRDRERLARATRALGRGSLAVVSRGGRVLHLAKVRGTIDSDRVRLSFCGREKYRRVLRHLSQRPSTSSSAQPADR